MQSTPEPFEWFDISNVFDISNIIKRNGSFSPFNRLNIYNQGLYHDVNYPTYFPVINELVTNFTPLDGCWNPLIEIIPDEDGN